MARTLLLLAAATIFLSACNKADEQTSPEDTLRGGQWKRTSLKSAYTDPVTGVVTVSDAFPLLDECVKDNGLEFKVNYAGTEHRNNKCSAGDADAASFTWEIYNSGKSIRIYNANETFSDVDVNADILNLSPTLLSMRYKIVVQDPSQTVPTDTFTVTDVFRR